MNKYFELKNSWGYRPNSNYLLSSVANRTQQHVRTVQPHTKNMSTHSFTRAWAHRHRQTMHTYIFLPLSFGVVQNNLASHAHVILSSHIVFLHFKTNTIKNAVTCTHRSQGHSSRCLVKAEEKSFECKQSAAGDNTFHCVLGISR